MKKYLIFLDIMGFNELPKELGEKSGFDEDSIRQNYLSDPLMRIIKMVENECNVIKGTDNYIIIADNLQLVSKVIGKVSTVEIPHKDYQFVPLEIAIDVLDLNDGPLEDKNRGKIIESLKNDIIRPYKILRNTRGDKIRRTFVLYTPPFYEELKLRDKHFFSEGIRSENKIFYVGDLDVLKDTSIAHNRINVAKFKTEIEKHRLWKYVEIKAFLFRTLDDDEWKIQFLYILLQKDKPDSIQALNTNHLRLLHRVHEIHELDTLLNQIIEEKRINIGDISGSLDLIPSKIKYFHKPNNTFGIVDDSYYLLKSGDSSEQLRKVETLLISEVKGHDNLKDLIRNSLQLDFWDGYYGPFFGLFAPIPLRAL